MRADVRVLARAGHDSHEPVRNRALNPPAPQLLARQRDQLRRAVMLERKLGQPRRQPSQRGIVSALEANVTADGDVMVAARLPAHPESNTARAGTSSWPAR